MLHDMYKTAMQRITRCHVGCHACLTESSIGRFEAKQLTFRYLFRVYLQLLVSEKGKNIAIDQRTNKIWVSGRGCCDISGMIAISSIFLDLNANAVAPWKKPKSLGHLPIR